jgi:uncharacterized repeat protein (TIGR01451 family)
MINTQPTRPRSTPSRQVRPDIARHLAARALLALAFLAVPACCLAQVLPSDKYLPSTTDSGNVSYQVLNSIIAPCDAAAPPCPTSGTYLITSGETVLFSAGGIIKLEPGFHASAGSSFHAQIYLPPETITTPSVSGQTSGNPNTSYTYTASNALSNLGHPVQYQFTWGDGTNSGWLAAGTTTASHTWTAAGAYSVTVQARCSTDTAALSTASTPVNVTVALPSPDFTIASTHSGNFIQGQTSAFYALTVTNSGPGATTGTITVADTVPTGLTATSIAGSGWSCTQPAGPCTRSDIWSTGAQLPAITLAVNVASNAPAAVSNVATVSGGGETNTSNDQATDPTTIIRLPQLTITSTHSATFTQADVGDTYTLTVSNSSIAGPTNGTTVTVTEAIPAGVVPTNIAGAGWTCIQPAGPCTRSDILAAGASYPPITLTVSIAPNAPATTTNAVGVSGGGSAAYSASDPTIIAVLPRYSNPLAFATPASVVAGIPVTMSITYTNDNGPGAITGGHG